MLRFEVYGFVVSNHSVWLVTVTFKNQVVGRIPIANEGLDLRAIKLSLFACIFLTVDEQLEFVLIVF